MTRRFLLPTLAIAFAAASMAQAAPASSFEIDNAKFQYLGQINGNNVHIRSGPSENDYPVLRLSKGDKVTITGIKFEWLKIAPPDGCFSYVSKLYIERFGDGSVGKVTKDNLNVWCGSAMSQVKSALQCRLNKGTDVQILGEADEYYKIKPPADAFVWVHQNMVTPLQKKPEAGNTGGGAIAANPGANTNTNDTNTGGGEITRTPTTQDSGGATIASDNHPATCPSNEASVAAAAEFDKLEEALKASDAKPVEEQTLSQLLASYEKLIANEALPTSMRLVAETRAGDLKARKESQAALIAARKEREEREKTLMALKAEQEELAAKAAELGQSAFTAVGTLQASSLQLGGSTLYRLTDPANGRTVVYVRSGDAKFATMIGQFAGVKGTVATESALSLRVLTATEIMAVDPAKVGKGVSAEITPPSLLSRTETARTE